MSLNPNTKQSLTDAFTGLNAAKDVIVDPAKPATVRRHALSKAVKHASDFTHFGQIALAELEADADTEAGL